MKIQVHLAQYKDVEPLRELYRQEANCQVVCDSALRRAMADPYVILASGRLGGYGAVWNGESRLVMEFHTLPYVRGQAEEMFRELMTVSEAKGVEAQTNMPLMLTMLYDCCAEVTTESILFDDALITDLPCPSRGVFRRAAPGDEGPDPDAEWVIEANDGAVVASGGFLCHYNPPYGDVYMAVTETARRQGFGSYVVQEVKRVCYEAGKKPAARCSPANVASHRTLVKAGFLPCGRLLMGKVATPA